MSEYHWRALGADHEPVPGAPAPAFPTQGDAEAWLSDSWTDLADAGVASVTLMRFDDVVYGPMSLYPA
ncbi:MAG: hypothetical protein U0Q21_00475 [Dermatophilaceae bacterium]